MFVKSLSKAWEMARMIFPTDFLFDENASKRAGYNIYSSTVSGNEEWISSLGNALELNMKKGTIRIDVIEDKPVFMTATVQSLTKEYPDYTLNNVISVIHLNQALVITTLDGDTVNTHTYDKANALVSIRA